MRKNAVNDAVSTLSSDERLAIQDLVYGVAWAVDAREFQSMAALFTEDARISEPVEEIADASAAPGVAVGSVPVAAWCATLDEFLLGFDSTHHQVTNLQIRVSGREVTSRSLVRGTHRIGDAVWVVGGVYHHTFAKVNDGWRIAHMGVEVSFQEGSPLIQLARARVASGSMAVGATR